MKTNALVRIALFALAIIILLGILIGGIALNYAFQRVDEITTYTTELEVVAEYDINKVSEIEIEWISGDIKIIGGATNDKVIISESGITNDKYKMICKHFGSKLEIKFSQDTPNFFGLNSPPPKELVIVVPRGWYCESIDISTASSDISFNDLKIGNVEIENASGKCEFLYCGIRDLDIDTASGDIFFDGEVVNLELDAASANGEFIISGFPENLKANMASGDLIFVLPDDQPIECHIDVIGGKFINEYPDDHNQTYSYKPQSCEIWISALSGDVTVMPHCKYTGHH